MLADGFAPSRLSWWSGAAAAGQVARVRGPRIDGPALGDVPRTKRLRMIQIRDRPSPERTNPTATNRLRAVNPVARVLRSERAGPPQR
jgi:hypothetical protein